MCDFTDNGPEINGTMVGVRVLRGAEAIYYMPINSKTSYYYMPSCNCNLSHS